VQGGGDLRGTVGSDTIQGSVNRHHVVKNPNPGEKVCHYYRMSHVQNPSCPGQIQEEQNDAKGNCRSWCAACQLPFHDTCHFLYHSSVLKMFDLNNFVSRTYNFSHPDSRHRPVDTAHAQGLVHSTVLRDTVQGPPFNALSGICPVSVSPASTSATSRLQEQHL
jgi:hypothetical protein